MTAFRHNDKIKEIFLERKHMKKNNFKIFFLSVSAYFAVCVLDLALTYIATPNLYLEGNPLVAYLDIGWTGLILINVITFVFYVALSFYAFVAYKVPKSNETELRRYLADINYGDPNKTVPFMWKLPKHWGPQIACLSWSVALALPISRLIIVVEWLLLIFHVKAHWFFNIVILFPGGRIDFFIAVLLAWILSFVWIKIEFEKNLKTIKIDKKQADN